MIFVTIKEISKCVKLSERTMTYKIAELKEEKKFKKSYKGKNYTVQEAQMILDLLKIPVNLLTALKSNVTH